MLILAALVGFYLGVFIGLLNYYANKYHHEGAKSAVKASIAGVSFTIFLCLCEIVLRFGLTSEILSICDLHGNSICHIYHLQQESVEIFPNRPVR